MNKSVRISGLGILIGLAALVSYKLTRSHPPEQVAKPVILLDEPGVRGVLRLTEYGAVPRQEGFRTTHHTTLVNGLQYQGMEDNDLRGFLDGVFLWGWNQPGQHHVRIGRRPADPSFREHEVFRVLERWDPIDLPNAASISNVRIVMDLEWGPAAPVRVELYEVKKDWNPGHGGIHRDNASPPLPGEVWWNDAGFRQRPWGLPGAGFASDRHPDADTGTEPLAEARYTSIDKGLVFASARLDNYVERRFRAGQPLLFLLKLADYQEDQPGSWLTVSSSDYGDSANGARRPRITLDWASRAEIRTHSIPLALEYGRSLLLPGLPIRSAHHVAASFVTESGYDRPTLEARLVGKGSATGWTSLERVLRVPGTAEQLEVRVVAAPAPLILGRPFRTHFRETWIQAGAPDDQMVRFTFISPTGIEVQQVAHYDGDSRWSIEFVPDELGHWRYSWEGRFEDRPFRSAEGRIDVVGGNRAELLEQLEAFAKRLPGEPDSLSYGERTLWMVRFARLERAALQAQTPESFRSAEGTELRRRFLAIWALLGVPYQDPIPLRSYGAPKWVRDRWGLVGDSAGPHGLADVYPKKGEVQPRR